MSNKTKAYTKKHLAVARRRQAEERKAEQTGTGTGSGFWRKHDAEMNRALRAVDPDRFEELAR